MRQEDTVGDESGLLAVVASLRDASVTVDVMDPNVSVAVRARYALFCQCSVSRPFVASKMRSCSWGETMVGFKKMSVDAAFTRVVRVFE